MFYILTFYIFTVEQNANNADVFFLHIICCSGGVKAFYFIYTQTRFGNPFFTPKSAFTSRQNNEHHGLFDKNQIVFLQSDIQTRLFQELDYQGV